MKALSFLLLLPVVAFAQVRPVDSPRNQDGFLLTNNSVVINGKAFTGSTVDTTEILDCRYQKTLYVNVQANDTTTVLIGYALSLDGTTFTSFATKDSLSAKPANSTASVKSVDMTSTILGARYAKFIFTHSANAYALGVTSPTYSASFTFKKY